MKIKNHLLYNDDDTLVTQIQIPSTNFDGALPNHIATIMHFTEGGRPADTIASFKKVGKYKSTHLLISREGEVWQFLPFNLVSYNCGSWWNEHSIGIELDNWGTEKLFHPIAPENKIQAVHWKQNKVKTWEIFYEPQIVKLIAIQRAIIETYGVQRLLGHEDVLFGNPDPGPAFPWGTVIQESFKDIIYPSAPPPPSNVGEYRVTATNGLNVRSAPYVQNDPSNIMGILKYNQIVVVYEISPDGYWARVGENQWSSTYYLEKVA